CLMRVPNPVIPSGVSLRTLCFDDAGLAAQIDCAPPRRVTGKVMETVVPRPDWQSPRLKSPPAELIWLAALPDPRIRTPKAKPRTSCVRGVTCPATIPVSATPRSKSRLRRACLSSDSPPVPYHEGTCGPGGTRTRTL